MHVSVTNSRGSDPPYFTPLLFHFYNLNENVIILQCQNGTFILNASDDSFCEICFQNCAKEQGQMRVKIFLNSALFLKLVQEEEQNILLD